MLNIWGHIRSSFRPFSNNRHQTHTHPAGLPFCSDVFTCHRSIRKQTKVRATTNRSRPRLAVTVTNFETIGHCAFVNDGFTQDVIHGFYIPALRINQDAVPGLTSTVWVQADKTGQYELRCTQFCGTNHYQMKGQLTVDTPEEFQAWLKSAKAAAF